MKTYVISDTSCLIALDRINHLYLLQKLYGEVLTTPTVQTEFGVPLPTWVKIQEVKSCDQILQLERVLDKGEASAIALALELRNVILIIDEKKGRKVAKTLNLEIIGTLKIILLAKANGIIPSVRQLLQELENRNFRFSKSLLIAVLKEAGE